MSPGAASGSWQPGLCGIPEGFLSIAFLSRNELKEAVLASFSYEGGFASAVIKKAVPLEMVKFSPVSLLLRTPCPEVF